MGVRIDKLFILPVLWVFPVLAQNILPTNLKHTSLPTPSLLVFPENQKPAFKHWHTTVSKMGNYSPATQWKIYKRWDAKMFETDKIGKGWNGKTPDGREAVNGIYPLIAETIDTDGYRHVDKGYLMITR
ncbi:MAG: hypothetical protein FJY15_08885 [Bacteroidetes bacterium]|nr:hypothetical protein [Bacteroidota bacterium]